MSAEIRGSQRRIAEMLLTTDVLALVRGDDEEGRCGFAPAFLLTEGPRRLQHWVSVAHRAAARRRRSCRCWRHRTD